VNCVLIRMVKMASISFSRTRALLSNIIKIRFMDPELPYDFLLMSFFFLSMLKHLCLQIIHVNLTQENAKPLESGRILDLTYSVKWSLTNVSFARRFDVYLDYPFFEHQVKSDVG